jgi:hypothetical protein
VIRTVTGMRTVLGVDPGGTTGIALLDYRSDMGYVLDVFLSGEMSDDVQKTFARLKLRTKLVDRVAVERFVVGRRSGRSSTPGAGEKARELVGLVGTLDKPVTRRSASAVKNWATNKRLEAAGLMEPTAVTRNHHDLRDAARHALMCLVCDLGCPDPLSKAYDRFRPGA